MSEKDAAVETAVEAEGGNDSMRVILVMQAIRFVAQLLLQLGVIDQLEARAQETEDEVDDFLVSLLRGIVTTLAQ